MAKRTQAELMKKHIADAAYADAKAAEFKRRADASREKAARIKRESEEVAGA